MAAFSGPEIPNSGLIFNLDAKNEGKTYGLTSVEVLVVAGGGGGGTRHGGGGGGGGVIYNSAYTVSPGTGVTVTIGQGGAGATAGSSNVGTAGQNSVFGSLTAIGGGYGSSDSTGGGAGGSGGGARGNSVTPGGSGTTGQGFAGGNGALQDAFNVEGMGGGGGGARTPGAPGSLIRGLRGVGGAGIPSLITGSIAHYGGGGGASAAGINVTTPGGSLGGIGGGGQGNVGSGSGGDTSTAGTPNTGGGGGAGGHDDSTNYAGKSGGSGIVVVRYQGPQRATGGTVTRAGNYTVHTFTSSGTFTPITVSSTLNLGELSNVYSITATGTPSYTGGVLGFNGTTDYYDISGSLSSALGSSITVSTFAKISSVVSKNNLFSINGTYNFFLPGNRLTTTYQLYWDSASGWKNGNTSSWTVGQWYHFAWTISATTLIFYVNGVADGTVALAGGLSPSGACRIGLGNAGEYLTGSIGDFKLFNRTLSASEVNSLYQTNRDRYGV